MIMSSTSSSDSSSMTMSQMAMVFFTSTDTPLFSASWAPHSTGNYAGTCIFLIMLAALFRFLFAVKAWKENAWLEAELKRRYVTVVGKLPLSQRISNDLDTKRMVLSVNGIEENVMVLQRHGLKVRPWRLSVEPVRACIDTVLAGIGYLLMIAAMTMNVGYFMSILAGTFLGSLLVGRYSPMHAGH